MARPTPTFAAGSSFPYRLARALGEAQQVVDILKKEGRVVDVHYYPNEGHGFVKRENQIDSIRRATVDS